MSYIKSKRPSRKEKKALRRGLLKLLKKVNDELMGLESQQAKEFTSNYWERRQASKKNLTQQWDYFFRDIKPKDRIVYIDKPYLRPIVRGKEIKKVEFGVKVKKIQVDGMSFIEHLNFDAFY